MKKVIVIGLDGLEPTIVEQMLAAGELSNLAWLRDQGGCARVATTTPAQTPVAWATFATGTNPGGHGIFDYIRRNPQTYLPEPGLNRYRQRSAFLPPRAVNLRRGTAVWQLLTKAGIPSVVLRCPCTYAPDAIRGRMLSGMGVPDLRGGFGTATFYTSADDATPKENENLLRVQPEQGGTIRTYLIGSRHPKTGADCRLELTIDVEPEEQRVVVQSAGQPHALIVRQGEWSDWLTVKFKLGMLQSAHGMVRFFLVRTEPKFELYASPINFDPQVPLFPISHPPEYARELADELGPFYTAGMVEDHNGLENGRFDESAYLDQCEDAWRERERMMLHELDRFSEGLFYCLFDTPDRVQHMFWRYGEPEHPANRRYPAADMAHVIADTYRRCDDVVGKVRQYVDDDTLLIVLSDHGFGSYQRGVHLNAWLHENGLLALRGGIEPGKQAGDLLRHVDWGRTKAYALGFGGIYLNLQQREVEGIVTADELPQLRNEIIAGLVRLHDPARGVSPVRNVCTRQQVYRGAYAEESPDLIVDFAAGYRASWTTALGGVPGSTLEDNVRKWSGDHLMDPALMPGVLLINRPFRPQGADLVDLAPTILATLGVSKAPAMEGDSLLGG